MEKSNSSERSSDHTDDTNFEQFITMISAAAAAAAGDHESEDPSISKLCTSQDCEHIGCGMADEVVNSVCDPNNPIWDSLVDDLIADEDDAYSSAAANETATAATKETSTTSKKGDRSRTLICERKRRRSMKEKLLSLRSLVPNITKMDKASIIGDAALYVQELQNQSTKLQVEIASLELLLSGVIDNNQYDRLTAIYPVEEPSPLRMHFAKMNVFQVEENAFYVRLVCKRGEGVAVCLYKAVESLTAFEIASTTLSSVNDTYVFAFTFNVKDCEFGVDLTNLELWVAEAFVNEGFDFSSSTTI